MRRGTNTFIFLLLLCCGHMNFYAQDKKLDSLLAVLGSAKEDTNKVNTLSELSVSLWRTAGDAQGMKYAEEALRLAQKLNFDRGVIWAYENMGMHYQYQGNYPEALKNYFAALKASENLKDKDQIAYSYLWLGSVYREQGTTYSNDSIRKELLTMALKYNLAALKISQETGHKWNMRISYNDIGAVYQDQGNNSEALKRKSLKFN